MVATLLSLKLRLTVAELKRSTGRLVVWIIMAVYALFMVALALIGLGAASLAIRGHEAVAGTLTVIVGSVVVLGWILLPLLFFGSDQTLDPARFTPFPLTGRQLAPGLVLAGVLGLPGFFTAVLSLGSALPWLRTPVVLLVGLLGGALGWLMTQLGARTATTALASTLSSRKARDLTGVIGLIAILALSMAGWGISVASSFFSTDSANLSRVLAVSGHIAEVLGWTPLGAPWALAGDAGQGKWGLLVCHLVATAVYLILGMWLYARVLTKALLTPVHTGSVSNVAKGDAISRALGWPWARGPMRSVAAIMARCLRYWRRDPRYLGSIPASLFIVIIFTVMGLTMNALPSSDGTQAPAFLTTGMVAFGLGFMALLLGYVLSADVASDATAWWIHLASGVKGWQDRVGRAFGEATWAVPLIVVVGIVVPIIAHGPGRIPTALGAMLTLYLAGTGVSGVASALVIYPVALPGESPMRMKTGMMGSQMLSQFACMAASGLLALPVCVWAIFARGWQGWLVLVVGLVWGGAVAVAGVILGGRVMDSRGPAILASLMKNDSRERA